jgi:hypothetical protein
MAIDSALPNPTKRIRISMPTNQVKEAVKKLQDFTKQAKLVALNDTTGFYRFDCKGQEAFSTGMLLELCVMEISDNITEVEMECRRVYGWIDRPIEYAESITFMGGCITLLGKVLTNEAQPIAQAAAK